MANWTRAFPGGRVRKFLAHKKDSGVPSAYLRSFIGSEPTPTNITVTQPTSFDTFVAYANEAFTTFGYQGDTYDATEFSLSVSYVEILASQSVVSDFFVAYPVAAFTDFSGVLEGVSYIASPSGALVSSASPFVTTYRPAAGAGDTVYITASPSTLTVQAIASFSAPMVGSKLVISHQLGYYAKALPAKVLQHALYRASIGANGPTVSCLNISYIRYVENTVSLQRDINLSWELLTGSAQSLEQRPLNMMHEQGAFTYRETPLNINYSILQPVLATRSLDINYALGLLVFEIDFKWAQTGSTWMTQLLALINAERALIGRAKMLRLYDGVGPDIATIQSETMRDVSIFAHDSPLYPAGWTTFPLRSSKLNHPHGDTAENLLLTGDTAGTGTTPQGAFDSWKASPIHYDNMMLDWGPNTDPTFLIGLSFWGNTPVLDGEGNTVFSLDPTIKVTYYTSVFIDMNATTGNKLVQRSLQFKWSQASALIEDYRITWSQASYRHVAARFSTPYAIVVSRQVISPWGLRPAAQHEAPQHYTVAAQHTGSYGPTIALRSSFTGSYDIQQYLIVAQQNASPFSMHVAAAHRAEYDDFNYVSAGFYAPYEGLAIVRGDHSAEYSQSIVVRAGMSLGYSYMGMVSAYHTASFSYRQIIRAASIQPYADEVRVVAQAQDTYNILAYNPARANMISSYSLQGATSVEMVDTIDLAVVEFSGRRVEHLGVEVSTSEDDFVWRAAVSIADTSDYTGISIDDPFTVTLDGTVFTFIVTGKSLDRDAPESVSTSISGHSENIRFTDPRASTISYTLTTSMLASDLAEDIVGVPISWGIVDWVVPPMYFAVENVTPIAAVQTIVEAAGGIIETTPSGQLVARYLFPVSVPNFATAPIDYLLTDSGDNLSYGESIDTTDVINKLRIRNGSDTTADSLEFTPDENMSDYGILRAYVLPWRTVEILHTGGATVALSSLTVESRTETELIEIVDGVSSLKYPAVSIQSETWESDPLGPLILDPRTREVKATDSTTNYGYGLVRVTYVVECYACSVQFPLGDVAQFILKTK